jgi:hypothetical protein
MNQTIEGLNQAGGPSYFVDLLIFLAIVGGYYFIAFKDHWMPKLNPPPKKDTSTMTAWQKVKSFGAASRHELTDAEWASIRKCRKVFLPIVLGYAVLLGFFSSTFGLVAMMWIWLATVGGMAIGIWSDRRIEKSEQQ